MYYQTQDLKTIRDFIRYATTEFNKGGLYFGHGTDNAWDDAVYLILCALHLSHDITPAILDARLTQEEKNNITNLIDQRVTKRIPSAYLIHEARFAELSFYVDERVLIPRSPIAELIEKHFEPWMDSEHINCILDLCTGSGCIAVACAHHMPYAQVDASDISSDALAVAKINVLRNNVEDNVALYQSDLFASLPQKQYDVIVSNPPYVSEQEMAELPSEYKHEPALGLAAGKQGLDIVIKILSQASRYLSPHGAIFIEVGNSEYALQERFPHVPFMWIEFERGGGGVFMLSAKELKKYEALFTEITI